MAQRASAFLPSWQQHDDRALFDAAYSALIAAMAVPLEEGDRYTAWHGNPARKG
jgi:hypothetical protein